VLKEKASFGSPFLLPAENALGIAWPALRKTCRLARQLAHSTPERSKKNNSQQEATP
jgi:hypothetical protein